jgi:hypothetical protein
MFFRKKCLAFQDDRKNMKMPGIGYVLLKILRTKQLFCKVVFFPPDCTLKIPEIYG